MSAAPPAAVEAAVLGNDSHVTRRVDIYEADGITPYMEDAPFTEGGVSVSMSRAERRSCDLTLDNKEGAFRHYPGGFWYDKILKFYRGVIYDHSLTYEDMMRADVPSAYWRFEELYPEPFTAPITKDAMGRWDLPAPLSGVEWGINGAIYDDPSQTGLRFFGTSALTMPATLNPWVGDFTLSGLLMPNTVAPAKQVVMQIGTGSTGFRVGLQNNKVSFWTTDSGGNIDLRSPVVQVTSPVHVAVMRMGTAFSLYLNGVLVAQTTTGTYVVPVTGAGNFGGSAGVFYAGIADEWAVFPRALLPSRLWKHFKASRGEADVLTNSKWEVQIGEFMIDRIAQPHFPKIMNVTGRDYGKKLLLSRFEASANFQAGTPLDNVVRIIATNAGIRPDKMIIPLTGQTLYTDFTVESNTERSKALSDLTIAYNYETFFLPNGYFVLQPFRDPASTPESFTFETGKYGNLVSFDKSSSDTRIRNHTVVESQRTDIAPIWAEAKNDNPNSPTNRARLGDRVDHYKSGLIGDVTQAQALATSRLRFMGLESFEVNMQSICFPWLQEGEVIEFVDPDPDPDQPSSYLMTDFGISMKLGPMDPTAKRVTVVG